MRPFPRFRMVECDCAVWSVHRIKKKKTLVFTPGGWAGAEHGKPVTATAILTFRRSSQELPLQKAQQPGSTAGVDYGAAWKEQSARQFLWLGGVQLNC
jgi:hypothetical protein